MNVFIRGCRLSQNYLVKPFRASRPANWYIQIHNRKKDFGENTGKARNCQISAILSTFGQLGCENSIIKLAYVSTDLDEKCTHLKTFTIYTITRKGG